MGRLGRSIQVTDVDLMKAVISFLGVVLHCAHQMTPACGARLVQTQDRVIANKILIVRKTNHQIRKQLHDASYLDQNMGVFWNVVATMIAKQEHSAWRTHTQPRISVSGSKPNTATTSKMSLDNGLQLVRRPENKLSHIKKVLRTQELL